MRFQKVAKSLCHLNQLAILWEVGLRGVHAQSDVVHVGCEHGDAYVKGELAGDSSILAW